MVYHYQTCLMKIPKIDKDATVDVFVIFLTFITPGIFVYIQEMGGFCGTLLNFNHSILTHAKEKQNHLLIIHSSNFIYIQKKMIKKP